MIVEISHQRDVLSRLSSRTGSGCKAQVRTERQSEVRFIPVFDNTRRPVSTLLCQSVFVKESLYISLKVKKAQIVSFVSLSSILWKRRSTNCCLKLVLDKYDDEDEVRPILRLSLLVVDLVALLETN